jgi:hypothetical protein
MWLQPELAPAAAVSSGLRIERQNRIPMPGFAGLEIPAASLPDPHESHRKPLLPSLRLHFPQSDLQPLGWDPRTVAATPPPTRPATEDRS